MRLSKPTNGLMMITIIIVTMLTACVPNRKYVYLQKNDVNRKAVISSDSAVRQYDLVGFDYKIQPEDILSIRVHSLTDKEYDFFAKDATTSLQGVNQQANPLLIGELVDQDGKIPFHVIGKIKVSGMTVYQVQDTLQKIADQYLDNPIVKVRLINFRYTILGEVVREGTNTLVNNRVSVLEAIGHAGGLTDLADKQNVKLIRQRNGKSEIYYINLLDEKFMASPYFFINQNDVLIIPALRQRPFRKYAGQNIALVVSIVSLIVLTINLTQ
jgi:polysaccharide biosynthesis/export protein